MSLHSEAVCDHVVGACQEAWEVMVHCLKISMWLGIRMLILHPLKLR